MARPRNPPTYYVLEKVPSFIAHKSIQRELRLLEPIRRDCCIHAHIDGMLNSLAPTLISSPACARLTPPLLLDPCSVAYAAWLISAILPPQPHLGSRLWQKRNCSEVSLVIRRDKDLAGRSRGLAFSHP
jgi:hypothetical protein